ncbi:hypothetical protein BDV06DRAFT_188229 [Aspergillus oleicola]
MPQALNSSISFQETSVNQRHHRPAREQIIHDFHHCTAKWTANLRPIPLKAAVQPKSPLPLFTALPLSLAFLKLATPPASSFPPSVLRPLLPSRFTYQYSLALTMFCLRSWLPLLFIPTNASPLFLISFVTLTYLLHRPCIYCSALLIILFASTCNWSDRCFLNLRSDWFVPRYSPYTESNTSNCTVSSTGQQNASSSLLGVENESLAGYVFETVNQTAKALAGAVVDETQRRLSFGAGVNGGAESCPSSMESGSAADELTGFGLEWLRSLVGRREWTLPCVDVKVRI